MLAMLEYNTSSADDEYCLLNTSGINNVQYLIELQYTRFSIVHCVLGLVISYVVRYDTYSHRHTRISKLYWGAQCIERTWNIKCDIFYRLPWAQASNFHF